MSRQKLEYVPLASKMSQRSFLPFSSDLRGWADRFFIIILSIIFLISILTLVDGQTLVREREGKVETPLPPFDRSPPAWST